MRIRSLTRRVTHAYRLLQVPSLDACSSGQTATMTRSRASRARVRSANGQGAPLADDLPQCNPCTFHRIALAPVQSLGHLATAMKGGMKWRSRGLRRWATPLVFAVLLLRAIVPAGFMLAPVDGRLEFVLCDSDAPGSTHRHAVGDQAGHHHTHIDSSCPFAQSSGAAPLPSMPLLATASMETARPPLPQAAQTHARFGPARQQSPRAPPHLA